MKEKYPPCDEDSLKRTKIFYCTHSNRKEGLFKKRILLFQQNEIETIIDILNTLTSGKDGISYSHAEMLFFHIFGKCRIRKNLRLSLTRLLEDMLKRHLKLDYAYYFLKNCPKMANWSEKKKEYIDRFERTVLLLNIDKLLQTRRKKKSTKNSLESLKPTNRCRIS